MCGGKPQAPQVVYQGPSQEQLDAQQAQLATYQAQANEQQETFKTQLQAQIDAANTETASIRTRYEKELTARNEEAAARKAAEAQSAAQQMGAYAVTATSSNETPTGAQTTAAVAKKNKPGKGLKINAGGLSAAAGTGLNIGV